MNATAALDVAQPGRTRTAATARWLVVVLLAGVAALAAGLLVGSALSGSVSGRLLAGSAEARGGGAFTQDLVVHLAERLRLAGGALLALLAGLLLARRPLERLVAASLTGGGERLAWPARAAWLALGATLLVALGLRLAFVAQPMRYDEALTFNEFASRPLYYGLSFYPDPNNHLLNTLLMHLAFVVLGNQPWVLRLPALLAGVLLVPATFVLAWLLTDDQRAAVFSAGLVSVSSYLVEYSTNARGYTLQALCFVVCFSLVVAALRRDSPRALLLATLVAALGAYALPTMVYGVAIVAAWLGLEWRRWRPARVGSGALAVCGLLLGLMVAVLYLPVLVVSGAERLAANRFVVPLDAADLAGQLPHSLARTFAFWNRDVPLALAALLLVGVLVATLADLRRRRVPLAGLAVGVCLALALVQRVAPFERVWLFLLPVYLMLAATGLSQLVARRLPAAATSSLAGLLVGGLALLTLTSGSIRASEETGAFPDAAAVASSLSGRLAADDAVVTLLPASLPELQYYFPRAGLPIETLVRSPDQARHVYVVAPPGVQPSVAGWGQPNQLAQYSGSALFELQPT